MGNAETLQRNNTRISENNTDLTSILDTVNNLPKAGAGFEINDCSYLFYNGARTNVIEHVLPLCKNVTNMREMFKGCSNLTNLDLSDLNTYLVNTMRSTFYSCKNLTTLDLSNFDTSNVTNMYEMFGNCLNLTNIDLSSFNTSNVTDLSSMFYACKNLTQLDLNSFNTNNATNISYMFYNCSNLTNLYLNSFDASNVKNISNILNYCSALTNLTFMNNLGKGYTQKSTNYSSYKLDLSTCTNLTHDSLMDVINKLYDLNLSYDVANGGTLYRQQLVLGSTNLAKLTEEEIAIATNKGWNVS